MPQLQRCSRSSRCCCRRRCSHSSKRRRSRCCPLCSRRGTRSRPCRHRHVAAMSPVVATAAARPRSQPCHVLKPIPLAANRIQSYISRKPHAQTKAGWPSGCPEGAAATAAAARFVADAAGRCSLLPEVPTWLPPAPPVFTAEASPYSPHPPPPPPPPTWLPERAFTFCRCGIRPKRFLRRRRRRPAAVTRRIR